MKHIFTGLNLIGAIALLALTVGCANTQHTENLLSAAGFRTVIANTPQRQEPLKALHGTDRIAMGVQFALMGVRSFMLEPDHAAPRHDANESRVQERDRI